MEKQRDIRSLQEIIIMIISWGYFPLSVAEKNRFFFKLIKLNQNVQPNVSIKENSEISKGTRVIYKRRIFN